MTKVPSLNYPEVIRAFERGGWRVVRQKGSHIRLELASRDRTLKIIIPAHKPIKRSTLAHILKQAEISVDEFFSFFAKSTSRGGGGRGLRGHREVDPHEAGRCGAAGDGLARVVRRTAPS